MSWHYQLMRHETQMPEGDIEFSYAIHEFFEFDDGQTGWTDNPCIVEEDSKESVEWVLKTMLQDVQSRGIRDYKTGEKLE